MNKPVNNESLKSNRHLVLYFRKFSVHLFIFAILGLLLDLTLITAVHLTDRLAAPRHFISDLQFRIARSWQPVTEATPFVFVDIDQNTYNCFNRPILLPRDKIAALIKAINADRGNAPKMILLDLDISGKLPEDYQTPSNICSNDGGGSSEVAGQTDAIALPPSDVNASGPTRIPTPVLIAITPAAQANENHERDNIAEFVASAGEAFASSRLHYGSVALQRESDLVVRSFPRSHSNCKSEVEHCSASALPSIALVAAFIANLNDGRVSANSDDPMTIIEHYSSHNDIDYVGDALSRAVGLLEYKIIHKDLVPIHFTIRGTLSGEQQSTVYFDSRKVPLLTRISALTLLENGPVEINSRLFKDRIVIIGGSFAESRDIYPTPDGPMPGALIWANAVHTVLSNESLPVESLTWEFGLSFMIILVVGALVSIATVVIDVPFAVQLTCVLGAFVLVLFFSFVWFSYLWMGMSVAVLAMLVHTAIDDTKNWLCRISKRRSLWRTEE